MTGTDDSPLKIALRTCRKSLVAVAAFSFAINLLLLASPLYMMQIFDRVISSGSIETLIYLSLIASVAIIAMGFLEAVRGRFFARVGRWLERELSNDVMQASLRLALRHGAPNAQPLRDLGVLRATASSSAMNAVFDAPWVPLFVIIIWLLHPMLGVLALCSAVSLFCVAFINELWSRKMLKDAATHAMAADQRAETALRNADAVAAMGMQPGLLNAWLRRRDESLKFRLAASDRNGALIAFAKALRILVQIMVLGLGAYLVLQKELTPGGMIAASILLGRALAPVEQSLSAWNAFIAARQSFDRLQGLLGADETRPTEMDLPEPRGRIECDRVIYLAPGETDPILKGVSFELEPSDALGLIGPSAAGKSTLCRILVGSWKATRGQARLDGANIDDWNPLARGKYVGYLPQDVELFSGTVQSNIARLTPDPDPAAVIAAAQAAGVHDLILKLPRGYDTDIGAGGSHLSAGQRQRIALARAFYGQPKLIVLDEPNSNLDEMGEAALLQAMRTARGWGATLIVVAHAVRILQPMDKLLVLNNGAVDLFGAKEDVMEKLKERREKARQEAAYPQLVRTGPKQD